MHALPSAVEQLHLVRGDHRQISLLHVDELAGVLQQRRNIRSDEVLTSRESEDHGRGILDADDAFGISVPDDGQRISALDFRSRSPHGRGEVFALADLVDDQVCEYL